MKPQSLFVLRLSVLAIATLLWVLCLWAGYVMFHSGIDYRMMGYEVMELKRYEEIRGRLVVESLRSNLTFYFIYSAAGIILMWRWMALWGRLRKSA